LFIIFIVILLPKFIAMIKREIENLNSYDQTKLVCDNNNPVWALDIPFATSYGLFENFLVELKQYKAIQDEDLRGLTTEKYNTRIALEAILWDIVPRVASYAQVNAKAQLKKFMSVTDAKLKKMTESEITTYGGEVFLKTQEVLDDLLIYGVTQLLLDDLESKNNAWLAIKGRPQEAYDAQKNAGEAIDVLFKKIDDVLINRLDLNALVFTAEHPDFVAAYQESRVIEHLPTTTLAIIGKVVDAVTQAPLYRAKIVLLETEEERKSSIKGGFRYQNSPEGVLQLEVSLPTYLTQTVIVEKLPGITSKVVVQMTKG